MILWQEIIITIWKNPETAETTIRIIIRTTARITIRTTAKTAIRTTTATAARITISAKMLPVKSRPTVSLGTAFYILHILIIITRTGDEI